MVIYVFDKVLHLLGGTVFALSGKHSITLAFLAGIMVEMFEVVTNTGRFDYYDILATGLGGILIYIWRKI